MNKGHFKTTRPVASLKQGRNDWYRIKNEANAAEIYIYDEIGFFGVMASDFVRELNSLDVAEITLHISSPGGEVFDGIAIYNALRDHKAKITVSIDSLAASAASFIALSGETVKIAKSATMMVHKAHGLCIGNSDDMRKLADQMDKLNESIAGIYSDKTNDSVESWLKLMTDETWFNAEEALAYGLADEIIHTKGSKETEDKWDLSVFNYADRNTAPGPPIKVQNAMFDYDHDSLLQALKQL